MTMLSHFAAAGGAVPVYIEDVFSTYLYTGNGSTQTITNGIDLAGKGGLVWIKNRVNAGRSHALSTNAATYLSSNTTGAALDGTSYINAFNSDGFTGGANVNQNGEAIVSWTFRKQPKFFDVVTYTGNGTNRTIAHNLGSVPGCIIVKRTDVAADWQVYHRSRANSERMVLNTATAVTNGATYWNSTTPTSLVFSIGTDASVNASGGSYVAYLFAHDAGGFGLTGTDNVISCGSYVGNGSATGPVVTLGYEPQWLMIKNANGLTSWQIIDNMRGMSVGLADATLQANWSSAETSVDYVTPNATGFQVVSTSDEVNFSGSNYIYIAIRRGPMKTPTTGTSVYKGVTRTGTGTAPWVASGAGFPPDMTIMSARTGTAVAGSSYQHSVIDRLRRATEHIQTVNTNAEGGGWGAGHIHNMDGYNGLYSSDGSYYNQGSVLFVDNHFRRAPGCFDVVCHTGDGSATRALSHNLGVAPELAIFKSRSVAGSVWVAVQKNVCTSPNQILALNVTSGLFVGANIFPSTGGFAAAGTATTLNNIGSGGAINGSGSTYVAYLFATCAGVSKVGSYTGTGTTKQVDCGFTGGARFVLIKRTDSTGDWYVWDSARGIVAGNDPYLLLNSTAAEVTSTDYIDTYSAGFEISSTAPAAINASGGSYIFLAIA